MASPKTETPVSPSIAIELTANGISRYINDGSNKVIIAEFRESLNFKNVKSVNAFANRLHELEISDETKERRDTYWTIGIPDNCSQEVRKEIIKAVEAFRLPTARTPEQANLEDIHVANQHIDNSRKPPPVRLINRSTAGAISYLQSIRDQERLNSSSEADVEPYLPDRHFLVMFVENRQIFGAEFKTVDGVVQQIKSYVFDDKHFEAFIEKMEKAEDVETLSSSLNSLWIIIANDVFKAMGKSDPKGNSEHTKIPAVFTYNSISYLIKNSQITMIPQQFVNSPEDKFSLFPSINGKHQIWPDPNKFILKGINVKTRMLAGDADMIDYDVSSGFVGEAIIECKNRFKASLIRDGEKLPIHRTIFKAKELITFQIDYDFFGSYTGNQDEFICKVDVNGIIINIHSDKLISVAKEDS
uniref:Uncharacterized protein n=1 Tax=Panagrolaimus sp. PS1159 TaxID=55785 RepID=A0AC35FTL1_9BILA